MDIDNLQLGAELCVHMAMQYPHLGLRPSCTLCLHLGLLEIRWLAGAKLLAMTKLLTRNMLVEQRCVAV